MQKLANLFEQLQPQASSHEYEYQEVCADLEKDFGKAVWAVAHRKDATEWKLREAGRIARMRGKTTLAYLIGVMKRL